MKRMLVGWLAFGVLLLVIASPGLGLSFGDSQDTGDEPTRITNYAADFDVSADGTMRVTEVITVDFPSFVSRHGIFRFFDRYDDNAAGLRRDPRDVRVLRDGSPEPYSESSESHGRYTVLKIGSAQVTLPSGKHTFIIKYTIDDVLLPVDDSTRSRFYWNLVPGGWAQRIDRAKLTVRLPAPTTETRCAVEVGKTSGCTVKTKANGVLRITASDLVPRTPVTLSTELALPAPETSTLPWAGRWDRVLGDTLSGFWAILGLAAMAGVLGLLAARTAHESTPPYPLLYEPPEGVGPAQAQYILTESLDDTAFVASMMYAAERGVVDLDRGKDRWTMTGKNDATALAALDPVTREVLDQLGVSEGHSFVAKPNKPSAGHMLAVAIASQGREVRDWASREGLMTSAGLGAAGSVIVILSGLAAFALAFEGPIGMTIVALIPGLFALGCLKLLVPGSGTRRSTQGRDLWSRIGGFRRALATPSSQDRFEFSARRELYTAYLPWAVAFGVAEEWAEKYRTEMGSEPPMPEYFAGAYVGSTTTNNFVGQMVNEFDSNVKSSISAYEASIRPTSDSGGSSSSSGGGGGFSGGGGGGGGGGGSW